MNVHSLALVVSIGQLLALILYGAYFVTFVASILCLMKKYRTGTTTMVKLILVTDVIIFLLVTGQMALIYRKALYPFLGVVTDPSLAALSASSPSEAVNIVQWSFVEAQTSVSSSLLIYRVWIMCQRKWNIIILPLCSLVGFIVCGGVFLRLASVPQNIAEAPDNLLPFGSSLALQLTALACDVITNVYCTACILYKIWRSYRLVKNTASCIRTYSPSNIMAIIIESAFLYCACIITLFATSARQSIALYVLIDLWPSVSGIAYCLIVIRFGLGGALKKNDQLPTMSIPWQSTRRAEHLSDDDTILNPIAIRVERRIAMVDLSANRGPNEFRLGTTANEYKHGEAQSVDA